MRIRYDANITGTGYYICDTCRKETPHPIKPGESLHKSTCEAREQGQDACIYVFGKANIISLKKWDRDIVAGLLISQLNQYDPRLLAGHHNT